MWAQVVEIETTAPLSDHSDQAIDQMVATDDEAKEEFAQPPTAAAP